MNILYTNLNFAFTFQSIDSLYSLKFAVVAKPEIRANVSLFWSANASGANDAFNSLSHFSGAVQCQRERESSTVLIRCKISSFDRLYRNSFDPL